MVERRCMFLAWLIILRKLRQRYGQQSRMGILMDNEIIIKIKQWVMYKYKILFTLVYICFSFSLSAYFIVIFFSKCTDNCRHSGHLIMIKTLSHMFFIHRSLLKICTQIHYFDIIKYLKLRFETLRTCYNNCFFPISNTSIYFNN